MTLRPTFYLMLSVVLIAHIALILHVSDPTPEERALKEAEREARIRLRAAVTRPDVETSELDEVRKSADGLVPLNDLPLAIKVINDGGKGDPPPPIVPYLPVRNGQAVAIYVDSVPEGRGNDNLQE